MVRLKQHIVWTVNRTTMGWNSVRMTATLAIQEIPLRVLLLVHRLRTSATPKRLVLGSGALALFVTPSVLYLEERAQHLAATEAYQTLALTSASEEAYLEASVRDLLYEHSRLTDILLDDGYSIHSGDNVTVKVVATGYSSSVWETDSTPFVTAANTRTREGVLAMSRDLLQRYTPDAPFDFGDRVFVSGLGYFIVEDSMNRRWDNRIDVWFPSSADAREFGIREVYLSRAATEDKSMPKTDTAKVSGRL